MEEQGLAQEQSRSVRQRPNPAAPSELESIQKLLAEVDRASHQGHLPAWTPPSHNSHRSKAARAGKAAGLAARSCAAPILVVYCLQDQLTDRQPALQRLHASWLLCRFDRTDQESHVRGPGRPGADAPAAWHAPLPGPDQPHHPGDVLSAGKGLACTGGQLRTITSLYLSPIAIAASFLLMLFRIQLLHPRP